MIHKTAFKKTEINILRNLFRKKARATSADKKIIRSKIRKIGFYISDFSECPHDFIVDDFDQLVKNGTIKIIDDNTIMDNKT